MIEQSDLEIAFSKEDESISLVASGGSNKPKKNKEKQRTEKWRNQRLGRWTGSQLKNLMSCSAKGGRMDWVDEDKVFHFGTSALKYIYENAMERKNKRYIDTGLGTKEMRYGTRVEPLILSRAREILKELKVKGKVKEVGFKQFPTMPNAGCSSDSILKIKKKVKATVELKACTSWSTHYERTFEFMDEKSKDFWQTQGQMISWQVDDCYYFVAQPPVDLSKYLYYEGDIMEMKEDFDKECFVDVQITKASKIHQNALLKRICIAENTINSWLKDGGNLKDRMYASIDFYKENPDKLNIYIN